MKFDHDNNKFQYAARRESLRVFTRGLWQSGLLERMGCMQDVDTIIQFKRQLDIDLVPPGDSSNGGTCSDNSENTSNASNTSDTGNTSNTSDTSSTSNTSSTSDSGCSGGNGGHSNESDAPFLLDTETNARIPLGDALVAAFVFIAHSLRYSSLVRAFRDHVAAAARVRKALARGGEISAEEFNAAVGGVLRGTIKPLKREHAKVEAEKATAKRRGRETAFGLENRCVPACARRLVGMKADGVAAWEDPDFAGCVVSMHRLMQALGDAGAEERRFRLAFRAFTAAFKHTGAYMASHKIRTYVEALLC